MAKKCKCECEECMPAWLATFGDLMSLLLCFFVLLLSMSTMDAKKIKEAIGSLAGALSVLEGGTQTEVSRNRIQQATPVEQQDETTDAVNRMSSAVIEYNEVAQSGNGPAISLEEGEEGFLIRLPADISFKNGSAVIENQDSILFLKRLALIIKTLPNEVEVQVRGFTDNVPPPRNSIYQDNWELSTARAVSVVKELIKIGVNPARLGAVGYSEYRPVTTNATPEGRAKNRRVDIYFFAKKKSVQQQTQKSLLDAK
jgi:chemotaxis protein MotB